jgi:biopolymer transport protein ExbB
MQPADAKHGISLVQTFLRLAQLGSEWVMWLLLGLGFVAAMLVFERLYLFMSTRVDVTRLARRLLALLREGRLDQAQELVKSGRALEERVISDALSLYEDGADAVEELVQASMIRERQRYERSLSYLGTVGSNAPFIGLLGTVIGVIIAFAELGRNPKGGLEVVGPGISEALVATAVGLVVAIPSLVCFNWTKGLLKRRLSNADFLSRIIITELKRKRPARERRFLDDPDDPLDVDAEIELPEPLPAGAE